MMVKKKKGEQDDEEDPREDLEIANRNACKEKKPKFTSPIKIRGYIMRRSRVKSEQEGEGRREEEVQ